MAIRVERVADTVLVCPVCSLWTPGRYIIIFLLQLEKLRHRGAGATHRSPTAGKWRRMESSPEPWPLCFHPQAGCLAAGAWWRAGLRGTLGLSAFFVQ